MERKILHASREDRILTNGEIYGTQIYLAAGVDASAFYEIRREEYEDILSKQEET